LPRWVGEGRSRGLGAVDELLLVLLLLQALRWAVVLRLRLLTELALGLEIEACWLRLEGRVILLYGLDTSDLWHLWLLLRVAIRLEASGSTVLKCRLLRL
jgi:hypothetical protein